MVARSLSISRCALRTGLLFVLLLLNATQSWAQKVSIEEVRTDYSNGDYRAAMDKTSRLLSSSQEPTPSDRYELLMIRGESQLQLKDRLGAVSSFKSAAKSAGDVRQLAAAKANALIIERSSMGSYTPMLSPSRQPIDVVAMDSRKQAMNALRDELWSRNQSQIQTALKATSLPPIEKVFMALSDMFFLETTATGQAEETGQLMRDLGQRAYRLMRDEQNRCAKRVDSLAMLANSSVGGNWNWSGTRRGLWTPERNELKEMAVNLAKLRDRAVEYREVASRLGGDEQKWDALVANTTETLAGIESLLAQQ